MVYFKVLAAQTLYFRGELLHESKLDGGKAVKVQQQSHNHADPLLK